MNSAAGPVLSVFSGSAELWLATQWDSNQSPVEFPANREFYREFRGLGDQRDDIGAENLRAAAAFCVFPYTDYFNKHICAVRAAPSAEMLIGVRTKVDDLSRERNALERFRTDSLSGTLLVWSGPLG